MRRMVERGGSRSKVPKAGGLSRTRSSTFFARSLTNGNAIGGRLAEAGMMTCGLFLSSVADERKQKWLPAFLGWNLNCSIVLQDKYYQVEAKIYILSIEANYVRGWGR